MFAILDLNVIRELSDRELKVYASLLALSHGGNGVIQLKDLMETSGKGKTQVIEIINNLIKKGLIKRIDRGKYEVIIKLNIEFEIELEGFNLSEKKKIAKIIKQKNLNQKEVQEILNYLKSKKIRDKVKYFGWLANNLDKIKKDEKHKIEKIKIYGVENFYDFQIYLNNKKINYAFRVIEKPKQVGTKLIGGEWEFEGFNLTKIYDEYKKTKNRRRETVGF